MLDFVEAGHWALGSGAISALSVSHLWLALPGGVPSRATPHTVGRVWGAPGGRSPLCGCPDTLEANPRNLFDRMTVRRWANVLTGRVLHLLLLTSGSGLVALMPVR